jgi:hypothetical protein
MKIGSLFGGKQKPEEMTRLNLESPTPVEPARPADANPATATPAAAKPIAEQLQEAQARQEAFNKSPAADAARRMADAILQSGNLPKAVYFARYQNSEIPVGLLSPDRTKGVVFLFSSPVLALHFLRNSKQPFDLCQLDLDDMEATARAWKALTFNSYIFDPSPEKTNAPLLDMRDGIIHKEVVLRSWAATRVTRNAIADAWRVEYLNGGKTGATNPETLRKQRELLEHLRDMGAYDVPFVHWVIAIIAGLQGDEAARLAATKTLEEFGPSFVGKTEPRSAGGDIKQWADSMGVAYLGLLAEFGMAKGPDGKPLPSLLKVESRTISPENPALQ